MPSPVPPSVGPSPAPGPSIRTWTLVGAEGTVDVDVHAPEDALLADVLERVRTELRLPVTSLWSGSTRLGPDTSLTAAALRHGATLGVDRPGARSAADASGALELHVVGGPDAGRALTLDQGDLVLGRGAGCGGTLADPDVSRRHVRVTVAEGRVTVADLGSSNGSTLALPQGGPEPVGTDAREWPAGADLRIGASTLRLTGPRGAALELVAVAGGRLRARPLRSTPSSPPAGTVRIPPPPAETARRRLGWVAVVLPALGGVLLAWLLHAPQFLFFALLSPVVAVAGWASDRVSGRRTRRRAVAEHAVALAGAELELDRAVAADLAGRDEAAPDLARLATAARRRSSPLWSRTGEAAAALTVRLGTGPGPTAVTRVDADGARSAATADHVPVTVPLGATQGLGVVGPRERALGVARSVLCQLAALTSPADLRLVLACGPDRVGDWRWCRWLPHLADGGIPFLLPDSGGSAGGPGPVLPRTVVVLDGTPGPELAAALATAGESVVLLEVAGSDADLVRPPTSRVEVGGETGAVGLLRMPGAAGDRQLVLDSVGSGTAERLARDIAPLTVPATTTGLPDQVRLLDLPGPALHVVPETGRVTGDWTRSRQCLTAVLGRTAAGPVEVDLVGDGPHALVAGTTGSGKSELLQTLVAGLALTHPPDRCSFLLVDYKGGAAFGAAADLPHTVGVLTDLDHQSTARALRSLSAELTRRERVLAGHGVRELADLPADVALARLVIVVDEFATLAEELPGFVSGLVGIAQRGRSLGVHLVLATQRPAGVVSPEIRANCSLRICLRTTDEADARDVLGSTLPARLPADRPGRAYLRRGNAAPVLLQVARVSTAPVPAGAVLQVHRRTWPPQQHPAGAPRAAGGPTDLDRLVGALAARAQGMPAPVRPWLAPLPDRLPVALLDPSRTEAPPTSVRIGLSDLPDAQRQEPVQLDLAAGGGWLFVGGPRSGRSTALQTVLGEAVAQLPADRLHVHVLDHGGGAVARLAGPLPHLGTAVGRDDAHRTVRLVARLLDEVDRRRSSAPGGHPFLLLLVDGWESLAAQLEEADPATGAAGLLRLAREGAAVGLTVALTAERAVPGSRLAGAVAHRLVLPLPDRADYAVAGVAARSVPGHRPPGRALLGEDAVECQLALPREPLEPCPSSAGPPDAIRVVQLPADPDPLPDPFPRPHADGALWLPLGPGGDDGAVVGLDVGRTGGLLVLGPPRSGRSTALRSLARHAGAGGATVAELVPGQRTGTVPADGPDQLDRTDAAGLRAWLAAGSGRPLVVVVDDLPALPEDVADALASGGPVAVLASGTTAELAGAFRGPAAALRRSRTALLLQPAPGEAELLGLRVPRTPLPRRPGSGWLVTPTEVTRLQVARSRDPGPS